MLSKSVDGALSHRPSHPNFFPPSSAPYRGTTNTASVLPRCLAGTHLRLAAAPTRHGWKGARPPCTPRSTPAAAAGNARERPEAGRDQLGPDLYR